MRTLSRIVGLALLASIVAWGAPVQAQNMPAPSPENPEAVEDARSAAQEWLALTDAGSFDESWNEAATLLQDQVTQEEWAQQSEQIGTQIGSIEERSFVQGQYREDIPNQPEGEYVFLVYETSATNFDQPLQEIVITTKEEGSWKVAGYTFRSAAPQQPQQPQQPPNN